MSDEIRASVDKIMRYFNGADLSDLETVVDANIVDHQELPGLDIQGVERLRQFLMMFRAAFPDLRASVEDVIIEGDRAVVRSKMSGTHQGEFMGIPPTGNQFSIDAIDIMRFADGKAVEHWGLTDDMRMLTQLGLMPTP